MRGRTSRALVIVAALLLSACVRHLVPAPGAQLTDARGKAAVASDAGVSVVARTDAWRGFPRDVDGVVTPLLVTIDNQSGRPLRIRYEQFALDGPQETRFAALAPYAIDGYVSEPVATMPYGAFGPDPFWHRPHLWAGYGAYPWVGPYGWSRWGWYDPWPAYRQVRLPTTDMVQQALPEAVLQSGERRPGFVFFERAKGDKGTPLALTMDLVDARTNERFGQVRIPFLLD